MTLSYVKTVAITILTPGVGTLSEAAVDRDSVTSL